MKDLFTSDQAFYQTLEQVVQMSLDFNTYYQKLNNIEIIEKALDEYERILIEIDRLYNYPELRALIRLMKKHKKLTQNLIRLLENLLVYYLLLIPRFWSYPMR